MILQISAFQVAGITGMSHYAWPLHPSFYTTHLPRSTLALLPGPWKNSICRKNEMTKTTSHIQWCGGSNDKMRVIMQKWKLILCSYRYAFAMLSKEIKMIQNWAP
jgi:hypothetical protein